MEGDAGRDLGCQKTMDGKVNEDAIPSCCLKARACVPDPELEANCHATVVSGWFSQPQSSSGCYYTSVVTSSLVSTCSLYMPTSDSLLVA